MARDENGHRWSGWPGAYCHYCMCEDPDEIALADNREAHYFDCPILDDTKNKIDKRMNP